MSKLSKLILKWLPTGIFTEEKLLIKMLNAEKLGHLMQIILATFITMTKVLDVRKVVKKLVNGYECLV